MNGAVIALTSDAYFTFSCAPVRVDVFSARFVFFVSYGPYWLKQNWRWWWWRRRRRRRWRWWLL